MVASIRRPTIAKSATAARLSPRSAVPHAATPKSARSSKPRVAAAAPAAPTPAAAAKSKPSSKPSSRRSSVQRSVPSSPQQQPAAATAAVAMDDVQLDMQSENTAAHAEKHTEANAVPAADTSAASATQSANAVPAEAAAAAPAVAEEPITFTAGEQKMLDTIVSVRQRLDAIEAQLPTLRGQTEMHAARLCAFRLAKHHRSPTFNANKLLLSHKSLRYNAGLIDEQTMQAIFRLDALQTDNAHIRRERKATVARGNKIIADSVELCKKIDKLQKWTPSAEKEVDAEEEHSIADIMTDRQATPEPPADAHMRPDTPTSPFTPTTAPSTRPASPTAAPVAQSAAQPATAPAAQPAAASAPALHPLQRKYAHLRLPTWRGPQFVSRVHPHSGALLIQADFSGIQSSDVSVSTDEETRTLTIRGVKLPSRRPSYDSFFGFAAPEQPFGYFEKAIRFADIDPQQQFQLAGMEASIDREETLTVLVPRAPIRRAAPQQPQQMRRPAARAQPVHFTSGYEDESEEDEQEAMARAYYAQQQQRQQHPFYAARQPQRAAPARHYAQASPFFGSNGWW